MRFAAPPRQRLSIWYFWYFAHVGAFTPYFSLYLKSLGIAAAAIGTMMSVMQAMRIVAPVFFGALADRLGAKSPVIRLSALLSVASLAVLLVTVDWWLIAVALAALAFFWSASLPMVEALTLAHLVGATEHYGRVRLWGSIGFIAAVLATGLWLDHADLSSLLWIDLALLLALTATAWTLADPHGSPHAARPRCSWRAMLSRPGALALLAASLLMAAAHGPFYVFYSIHLVEHGYGKAAIGLLWALGVVAEIMVFIAMPRLLRLTSARSLLIASLALAVFRFAVIGWLVDSAIAMIAAQILHGATFGAAHASAVALLNASFPAEQQGRAQALYGSVSIGVGGMLGNLLGGAAWQGVGPALTFSLGSILALAGLVIAFYGLPRARKADSAMR